MTSFNFPNDDAEYLHFALQAAGLGIWSLDPISRKVEWNDRCKQLYGFTKDDIVPIEQILRYIHPDDRDKVNDAVTVAMQPGSADYNIRFRTIGAEDGKLRWLHCQGKAFFDNDGVIIRFAGIAQDITEQEFSKQKIEQSERKFRMLIMEAPFATALYVGEQLLIDVANVPMIELWGKTTDVIGRPLALALPELDGQPFIPLLQEVFKTGIAYQTKEQSADLVVDGALQRFWFNFTYKPILDEEGNVYAILNMAVDITSQVKNRQAIEEAESNLYTASELAELANWSIDWLTKEVSYSPRMKQWLGIEEGILSENNPRVSEQDRRRVNESLINAAKSDSKGLFDEVYTIINQQTGKNRIIRSVGKMLFDASGNPLKLSGTAQDITSQEELKIVLENTVQLRGEELAAAIEELRASNEELTKTNQHLVHSNDELTQYAYVASHDLREPLRKIQYYSNSLQNAHDVPDKLRQTIDKIEKSSNRMSTLLSDLLQYSRLLKTDALFEPIDLNIVLSNIMGDFEVAIKEKNAIVKVHSLPKIQAINLHMNQLFSNLIGNALKFSKADQALSIEITCEKATADELQQYLLPVILTTTYYHIQVRDTGIGIDAGYTEQIFDLFKRLHSKDAFEGSGIGLALCRRIARNHNGEIFAEGQPGTGSVFHVLLPEFQNK